MHDSSINRQSGFDVIKIIACLFVVLIHIDTPLKEYYFPYIRCAVPVFFCVAGYFSWKENKLEMINSLNKRIKYFCILFIYISFFYIILNGLSFNYKDYFLLFVFNQPWYGESLWFVLAYLYVLIVLRLFAKSKKLSTFIDKYKLVFLLIPVLLVVNWLFGTYSEVFFDKTFPNYYTRNFLFEGMPYFLTGCSIRKYGIRIKNDSVIRPLLLIALGIICISYEVNLLGRRGLMTPRYSFLGTFIMTIAFMLFAQNVKVKGRSVTTTIAKKYLLPVYLFHPFCCVILDNSFLALSYGYCYLIPFYCILFVVFMTRIFEYVTKR